MSSADDLLREALTHLHSFVEKEQARVPLSLLARIEMHLNNVAAVCDKPYVVARCSTCGNPYTKPSWL